VVGEHKGFCAVLKLLGALYNSVLKV